MQGMDEILSFGSEIFEGGLISFLFETAITVIVMRLLKKMIIGSIRKAAQLRGDTKNTAVEFLAKAVSVIIDILMAFLIVRNIVPLKRFGTTLLGATSLVAVFVGIAAQEAFGNIVSGLFLALYQPFKINDQITILSDNISGAVTEINMRHTVVRTFDGTYVIIPNSRMGSAIIEDKSMDQGYFAKLIQASVAYDTDIDFAKQVISDAVSSLPGFIDPRTDEQKAENAMPVTIVLTEFEDSGIQLSFRVMCESVPAAYGFSGEVREAVLKAFRKNNIEIPYPTRTIEMKS